MFTRPHAQDPFERLPGNGFRCVEYPADSQPTEELTGSIILPAVNTNTPEVSDEVFQIYKERFEYADTPLQPVVEQIVSDEGRTRETVVLDPAYDGDPLVVHLELPADPSAPFQAVIYLPTIDAMLFADWTELSWEDASWVRKSGRALIKPVFESTYHRGGGPGAVSRGLNPKTRAEIFVRWSRDLGRTIDYLESRGDIDTDRIACLGMSLGAMMAPVLLVNEDRVKASVFIAGGFTRWEPQPAVDPMTYLPRVTTPVLMIGGRHDPVYPFESAQQPFFDRLGTPKDHKRFVVYDVSHYVPFTTARSKMIKESLAWLDKYLGPVERAAQ
jgi:predicted esterase